MKPLSIILICPFLEPATEFGGPVEVLRHIAPELARRGHTVSTVGTALGIPDDIPRDTWVDRTGGYRSYYASTNSVTNYAPHFCPAVQSGIRAGVNGSSGTIIHLHLGFTHANILARRIARRTGVPYIMTPHGVYGRHHLARRKLSKKIFYSLFERHIVRNAAILHALSEPEAEAIVKMGVERSRLIVSPNGVDVAEFDERTACQPLAERCGFSPSDPILLFLSRIHPSKGLDLLIPAFAEARKGPAEHWQLVVAGPDDGGGEEARALAAQLGIAEFVHLTGPLAGDEKWQAFNDASAYALTSYAEGIPLSILESCAASTPVLVTDRCNLPEVAECEAGIVCRAEHGSVGDNLSALLAGNGLEQMGQNARRMAETHFSWEGLANNLEQTYEKALAFEPGTDQT